MDDSTQQLMAAQKARIEEFKRWSGLGWKDLAAKVGFPSTQNFTDMRNGRYRITPRVVDMITEAFPEVSREWLTYGTGDMLSGAAPVTVSQKVPFFAGFNRCGYIDPGTLFGRVDAALKVPDPAMSEYPKGSLAMLRRLPEGQCPNPGSPYAVRANGKFVVRRVSPSDNGMTLFPSRYETMPDGKFVYPEIFVSDADAPELYEVLGYAATTDGMFGIDY